MRRRDNYGYRVISKAIETGRDEEVERILAEIAEENCTGFIPFFIQQMETTNNPILRNEIALTLSDIFCADAVWPIIKLLKNPKTLGNRGTLLYVLTPLDYSPFAAGHTELLLDFLVTGNFEVSYLTPCLSMP